MRGGLLEFALAADERGDPRREVRRAGRARAPGAACQQVAVQLTGLRIRLGRELPPQHRAEAFE
jgi:hypothetical protein